MKLNIGCGDYPLADYINIDINTSAADWQLDFHDLEHRHPEIIGACEEVRADHWLEHQSWKQTAIILETIHSWLQPQGVLHIEVPDLEQLMLGNYQGVSVNQAIFGSQHTPYDYHHAGWTQQTLRDQLKAAGYQRINTTTFPSTHPARQGYPCLIATATRA